MKHGIESYHGNGNNKTTMHGGAWWKIIFVNFHPITDWAPSLPSVLSSKHVAMHVQAAEDQHYYKPAEPAYES
jgi:hypothetical protein